MDGRSTTPSSADSASKTGVCRPFFASEIGGEIGIFLAGSWPAPQRISLTFRRPANCSWCLIQDSSRDIFKTLSLEVVSLRSISQKPNQKGQKYLTDLELYPVGEAWVSMNPVRAEKTKNMSVRILWKRGKGERRMWGRGREE